MSRKTKRTPTGWISGNAVCCHNRNQRPDTKKRGGMMMTETGFVYSCFNCNFHAGYSIGKQLSTNTKNLFKWLGASDLEIGKLNLLALKIKDDQPVDKRFLSAVLEEKQLPEDCKPIDTWIEQGCQDPNLLKVIEYLVENRKVGWDWYPWHWSPAAGFADRVIIPFFHDNKIVGWTGRKITLGNPKYLTETQPGYVFNLDNQHPNRKYVIVVEGQFDAITVDGVAVMGNDPNQIQCNRINALGREVIVVPDRDAAGSKLIATALNNKWSVSLPPWESDVKDVADAGKRYGRLYTLSTILHYKESNEIKIQLLKKKLESLTNEQKSH